MQKKDLKCFALPESAHSPHDSHPILALLNTQSLQLSSITPSQQVALSRLTPLLLCGEQSAMFVFHKEAERLAEQATHCLNDLHSIEADEFIHEQALQHLQDQLPTPADIRHIKRKAQLFYARINKSTISLAQHFELISHLDACVCLIMSSVASCLPKNSIPARLFHNIMKDEARHVTIARQHSEWLNENGSPGLTQIDLHQQLIKLLTSETESLENLGVDTQQLFSRILQLAEKRNLQ